MRLLFFLLLTLKSSVALAYPSNFILFSPEKVTLTQNSLLQIELALPCTNNEAVDWSKVIMTNDDSGDRVIVVGIAVAMSQCKPIPKNQSLKLFKMTVDPKKYGYTVEKESETFQPMELAPK